MCARAACTPQMLDGAAVADTPRATAVAGGVLAGDWSTGPATHRAINMIMDFKNSKLHLVKVKHVKSIFQKRMGVPAVSVRWAGLDLTNDNATMKDIGVQAGEADFEFIVDSKLLQGSAPPALYGSSIRRAHLLWTVQ